MLPIFCRPPGQPGVTIANALGIFSTRESDFTAPGNVISQVTDITGNADHAVQATGADQPTLNLTTAPGTRAILFAGTDHLEHAPNSAVRAIGFNIYVPASVASERPVIARAGTTGSNPAIIVTLA